MTETRDLTQTLAQFISTEKIPDAINAMTAHIEHLDENNTPLRFPHLETIFSEILAVDLTPEESQLILSKMMDLGYADAIARLIGLPSPDDLVDFLIEIAPNEDPIRIQKEFLAFITENAHLEVETLAQKFYEFTPSLFATEISNEQIDIMLYLASQVNDKYAEMLKPIVGMPMIPPTIEDELALHFPESEVPAMSDIVRAYIDEKAATNTPIRIPHAYGDFLTILSPEITHQMAQSILMILSLDEHYTKIFDRLLLLGDDDLTEFLKILVDPEEVEEKQTALIAYINQQHDTHSENFMQSVYPEVKAIFDNQISDADVNTLLYYLTFVSQESQDVLDGLIDYSKV